MNTALFINGTFLTAFCVRMAVATTNTPPEASPPDNRITITTISGITYSNCNIRRVDPDGINVITSKGISKIPFVELPDSYKQKYGYDPQKASDYMTDKHESLTAYQAAHPVPAADYSDDSSGKYQSQSEKIAAYEAKQRVKLRAAKEVQARKAGEGSSNYQQKRGAEEPFGPPSRGSDDPFGAPSSSSEDPFGPPSRGSDDPFGAPRTKITGASVNKQKALSRNESIDLSGRNVAVNGSLIKAVEQADIPAVDLAVKRGGNINVTRDDSATPLHIAVMNNKVDLARWLLAHGADVNACLTGRFTPLHVAVQEGNIEIVSLLIEKGADVNAKTKDGYTPLISCPSKEMVPLLVQAGADVNAKGNDGFTPLHFVSDIESARILIKNGANPRALTKEGYTPARVLQETFSRLKSEGIAMGAKDAELYNFLKLALDTTPLPNSNLTPTNAIPSTMEGKAIAPVAITKEIIPVATTNSPLVSASKPENLVTIITVSGTAYSNCVIRRVEPDGINVVTTKGIIKIPFSELPESYRIKYGYDPQKAGAYATQKRDGIIAFRSARTANAENEPRETHSFSGEYSQTRPPKGSGGFFGVITQVLNSGALMVPRYIHQRISSGLGPYPGMDTTPIFVEGDFGNYVDNQEWKGVIRRNGVYKYEAVGGVARSVMKYVIDGQ